MPFKVSIWKRFTIDSSLVFTVFLVTKVGNCMCGSASIQYFSRSACVFSSQDFRRGALVRTCPAQLSWCCPWLPTTSTKLRRRTIAIQATKIRRTCDLIPTWVIVIVRPARLVFLPSWDLMDKKCCWGANYVLTRPRRSAEKPLHNDQNPCGWGT